MGLLSRDHRREPDHGDATVGAAPAAPATFAAALVTTSDAAARVAVVSECGSVATATVAIALDAT